jgi:anti-anti-sigma factor
MAPPTAGAHTSAEAGSYPIDGDPSKPSRTMERQDFHIECVRPCEDTVVLRAAGEIDLSGSVPFREQIGREVDGPDARIVLDMTPVSFIDSSGLSVLVVTARRLFLQGRELVIVCPDERIRRVLSTAGLDRLVAVHARLGDALAGSAAGRARPAPPAGPR